MSRLARLAAALALGVAVGAAPTLGHADAPAPVRDGRHDFDLRFGKWKVHHHKLKERLANNHDWIEFDGTLTMWPVLGGLGNVSDNLFNMADGPRRGVSLRSYDPKTGVWSVWWLDGNDPTAGLDPPMTGRFEDGAATLYGEDKFKGKRVRVRASWTHVTRTSAHWEQAYSPDDGKTWEVNWTSDFVRVP